MMRYFRKRLFWKFFFSHFGLVLLVIFVVGLALRILLPLSFSSRMDAMMVLLTEFGMERGHMLGGHGGMMMNGSPLFTGLFNIFNQVMTEAVFYAGMISLAVSFLVSALMSRRFVTPLRQMSEAAVRIAEGDFQDQLPVAVTEPEFQDELERLAVRFNRMAARLGEMEKMRQQLIGDVAHELRTPLTVIKGAGGTAGQIGG